MKSNNIIDRKVEQTILSLQRNPESPEVFKLSKKLAEWLNELIHKNQMACFKRCTKSVLSLYQYTTSNKVKLAIENVFIYKLCDTIMLQKDRGLWMGVLPARLKEIACRQVFASGI